jgi:ATP-dependent exoDNAse (exonuclease V) beta subunit
MKKSNKYDYIQGKQITDHETGTRVYDIIGTRLPSVTTILGATKNKQFLKDWKAKVGEEEAERIKNLSSKRGTAMHKFLEKHIQSSGYDDLTEIGQQAKPMAQKIIDEGLIPISEYYGSEIMVHYPGLYAGCTDLVCNHTGLETIVDFKQSNRPKREEWVSDYYMQIAAYAMAHDEVYGSRIRQGVIMICTPDLYYQEFKIQDTELKRWKHRWLARLDMYHELERDENDIMSHHKRLDEHHKRLDEHHELLEEFERDGS